jgi:hypothetical protein
MRVYPQRQPQLTQGLIHFTEDLYKNSAHGVVADERRLRNLFRGLAMRELGGHVRIADAVNYLIRLRM